MLRRTDRTADPAVPAWLDRAWHSPWPWFALVALLFCAPLFATLHQQDFDNDEAIYSFAVDTMLKDGDWLTPKSAPNESSPFLEKPPLKFWMVALPIKAGLLPANEFGMRFWDAVMGSVAFLYVFAIGRRLAGPICGFVAVFLLFTHGPLVLAHGLRTNNMEAAVFLSYAAGIYHFMAWRTAGPDDRSHIFAMALYFVLGFMTKFVAALFLPLVLGVAVFVKPEDRFRLRLNWLTFVLAGLVALALIAPWFVYQQLTHPQKFFAILFSEHVLKRLTVYLDPTHLHPWYFYLTELWRELRHSGTAAVVVFGAGLLLIQTWRRRWLDGLLMVLWFVLPVSLISAGTSKIYHYAYPFLPPVALAGGYGIATIAARLYRWLDRPAAEFTAARGHSWLRWFSASPARVALTTVGVAALVLGAATEFTGRTRILLRDTLLLRNESTLRPLVAGSLALFMGGPALAVRTLLPALLVLALLPFPAYRTILTESKRSDHVLSNARACLSTIVQRLVAGGGEAPGVWAETETLTHRYNYYLRGLGPWEQRSVASDATVATHLFDPSAYRPVLLSETRFNNFVNRLTEDSAGLLAIAARKAGVSPDAMMESSRRTEVSVIRYDSGALILPGPYRGCGTDQVRGIYR